MAQRKVPSAPETALPLPTSEERSAAQVLIQCLEAEGVQYIFGIPGEETLDLMNAIHDSKQIRFITTRHEQGAAFMAET